MRESRRTSVAETQILKTLSAATKTNLKIKIDDLLANFAQPGAGKPSLRNRTNSISIESQYKKIESIAATLMTWHTDSKFLTEHGTPRLLPEKGEPSLTSLVARTISESEDPENLIRELKNLHLIKKTGNLFSPVQRSALLGKTNAITLAYATGAVEKLLETITHNVSKRGSARYQRQVSDVTIRAEDLPMFLRFVEQQGQYLIDAVDDWLSKRVIRGSKSKTDVSVGLGAYCWVRPQDKSPRQRSSRSKKRARSL